MMSDSLRTTFNEDAANYQAARPGYPDALYADIFRYMGINGKETAGGGKLYAMEIGIGTGQATGPFLLKQIDVTAVELGDNLARAAAARFAAYKNLHVVVGDVMEVYPDPARPQFDLIYAATAFHWLPEADSYRKMRDLLLPDGVLALFWNHPNMRNPEDETNLAAGAVYDRLRPSPVKRKPFTAEQTAAREEKLRENGFRDVEVRLYERIRELSTEEYIALLNTYSDHRALEPALKARFESEMRSALGEVGDRIRIYDTIDLYLGRK